MDISPERSTAEDIEARRVPCHSCLTNQVSCPLWKPLVIADKHSYFLFSPMLPSATVGTLELRSLLEPIRRIVGRVHGHFLKANAEDVEFSEKLVEVSQVTREGERRHFYLPYDKLVIGVGMDS